ncbi:hypothetical protein CRUP_023787 [Coryphaenoides rupestris]|nr:hypothetical protein CRUP_023787 [Coryphaenoides rupestris]
MAKRRTYIIQDYSPVYEEIRRLARKRRNDGDSSVDVGGLSDKVHICSVNNFPTAAGLASSAAGFACLVYTLARVYGVEGELSGIARQGSGSACRSMYGGFVQWIMGEREDGEDSVAQQVEPESHWPDLRVLVLVHRAESVVPDRMKQMIEAVHERDFAAFAELTMRDSNQFHATCLDTYPPIFYLNTQHVAEFLTVVRHFFPPDNNGKKQGLAPVFWRTPACTCLELTGYPRRLPDQLGGVSHHELL